MSLFHVLSTIVREQRLDYFGIADMTAPDVQAFIRAQSGGIAAGYPRAVAVGLVLSRDLVDLLPAAGDRERALYKHHVYNVIAGRMDQATSILASALQAAGSRALTVPASVVAIDRGRFAGVVSQKLAPHLAGLGWIGKSCMLITPRHGPRVIWGTVLTDAQLEATGTAMPSHCGRCHACVDACPAHAYTGREFVPAEPREARFDAAACYRYIDSLPAPGPEAKTCGLCLHACPHGQSDARARRS